MENVTGHEEVEEDESEDQVTRAIVWPARSHNCQPGCKVLQPAELRNMSPVAGHVAVGLADCLLVWGGYFSEREDDNEFAVIYSRNRSPASLFVYPTSINRANSANPLVPPSDHNDLWIEFRVDKGDVPPSNSGAAAVICNHSLVVFGGFTDVRFPDANGVMGDQASNRIYSLCLNSLKWTKVPYPTDSGYEGAFIGRKVPTPRHKASVWEWHQKAYFFGGFGLPPHVLNNVEQYLTKHGDFVVDTSVVQHYDVAWNNQLLCYDPLEFWCSVETGGCRPSARAAAAVCPIREKDQVILFGGRHRNLRLNDLYILDLNSLVWTQISISLPVPDGRSWMSLSRVSKNHMVLYGGFSTIDEPLGDAWSLDLESLSWKRLYSSLCGRKRLWHVGVAFDGSLFVCGGYDRNLFQDREMVAREVLLVALWPKSLLSQCLNTICRSETRVLEDEWIASQLPLSLQERLILRSTLLRESRLNARSARPRFSTVIHSLDQVLCL